MSVAVREYKDDDIPVIKLLFTAYCQSLPVDISYQNYQDEFRQLPGKYAHDQGGALFVAERNGKDELTDGDKHGDEIEARQILGCVALRKMDETACELKRLYVLPQARGLQVGQHLVAAAVEAAKRLHYRRILLDTLPTMTSALRLYQSIGFSRVPRYYDTPIQETIFLEKRLE